MKQIHIAVIVGSLRRDSFNRKLAKLDLLVIDDFAISPIGASSATTCWKCWMTVSAPGQL